MRSTATVSGGYCTRSHRLDISAKSPTVPTVLQSQFPSQQQPPSAQTQSFRPQVPPDPQPTSMQRQSSVRRSRSKCRAAMTVLLQGVLSPDIKPLISHNQPASVVYQQTPPLGQPPPMLSMANQQQIVHQAAPQQLSPSQMGVQTGMMQQMQPMTPPHLMAQAVGRAAALDDQSLDHGPAAVTTARIRRRRWTDASSSARTYSASVDPTRPAGSVSRPLLLQCSTACRRTIAVESPAPSLLNATRSFDRCGKCSKTIGRSRTVRSRCSSPE